MKFWLAFAAALLLAALAARAQDDHETRMMELNTESYNANIKVLTDARLNKDMLNKTRKRYNGEKGAGAATSRSVAKVHTIDFFYMESAPLRKQTVDKYLAKTKATDPAAAAQLASALRPGGAAEYRYAYPKINRAANLRDNDAADILASYMLLNWRAANNVAAEPTAAQARGVRAQAARSLSKKPQTDEALAALGEDLKLQAVLLNLNWQSARQHGTAATFGQQTAAAFQREHALDLRQQQLSAAGLTAK